MSHHVSTMRHTLEIIVTKDVQYSAISPIRHHRNPYRVPLICMYQKTLPCIILSEHSVNNLTSWLIPTCPNKYQTIEV